ncbi:hypothetical protein [Marinobacter adhaerens]|uniref:hypothetical protein n=1 Tax=Marinobacter adhaerens TaxID=1033846 RepID=UPI001428BE36|nr:hypothetical protein [Marinobacter adhaerens]
MSNLSMPKFPPSFLLLQQEGYLISSSLTNGLTELRSAHVHNKGAFYTSLFNLSVGFERLLKAIVIIDHMLNHQLAVPTKKQLQVRGHNIVDLYDECERIGLNRNSPILGRPQLDAIDNEFLQLLSDFARVTRYHNLDALSASHTSPDPLVRLNQLIVAILAQDVPKSQKDKILKQAGIIVNQIDDITFTLMHGLDQRPLSTSDALSLPGLHEQSARFAVLRIIKLLAPLRDLLAEVSHGAYGQGPVPAFPQMQEFLEWLWDDRQYVLRKRKWP